MQRPEWLTGLDASFLNLETAIQPLQMLIVLKLDTTTIPGGYSYDRFRQDLAERIRAVPEFREKLSSRFLNIDHPAWVEDREFNVAKHVHRIAVPEPGGPAELDEIFGYLAGLPLNRFRPLWEMWVIEGVDGTHNGDLISVVIKIHHSAADGVTYAELFSQLCSTQPDPPRAELVVATGADGPLRIAAGGLARFAARPVNLVTKVLPETVHAVRDAYRRAALGRAMAAPFSAPPTLFNSRFTANRNVAFTRLDLNEVKKVKNQFGVTVNDVVTAIVSGSVRQFLLDRRELPSSSLTALVPASVHEPDRLGRNQVSGMIATLQTQIADPVERLRAVAESNTIAKEHSAAIGATLLEDWMQLGGRALLAVGKRIYGRVTRSRPMYNVVVSNVPGPQPADYFLGAKVLEFYPVGPVMLGAGLNITVCTVGGVLNVGLISCPDVLPDLPEIAEGLTTGLNQLLARCG
ncbi:MAG: WS/DGAT/MGAT family O-acyltransferase [Mycobacterium sp.]